MQFLIVLASVLAAVSAGYIAPVAYAHGGLYAHAQHIPVIGPHGVPLEPAANVAARAAHAAAHAEAHARNGHVSVVAPYAAHHGAYYAHAQHLPVIGPNGVPLEPAANVAARAAHAAAHVEAKARNGDHAVVVAAPLAYHHAPLAYSHATYAPALAYGVHAAHTYPALAHNGQPLETPEVVAAKSAHFAAHAEARARNGAYYGGHYGYAHLGYGHAYPLDTPEVAHAKAAHLAAHAAVRAHHAW